MLFKQLRTTIVLLVAFSAITGVLYPLAVTGVAQLFFPEKANGSLILKDGTPMGSVLIGQPFHSPKYFWGRLSATGPFAFNAAASSGSNYGPLHPLLLDATRKRVEDLRNADPQNAQPIPVDLVTASSSGLDPHMSIAAALYQVPRVARERGITEEALRSLVDRHTEQRDFGFLGEPGVHVLNLNLALDLMISKGNQ
jgi:K+-transporting ATPase ATPase C chain